MAAAGGEHRRVPGAHGVAGKVLVRMRVSVSVPVSLCVCVSE